MKIIRVLLSFFVVLSFSFSFEIVSSDASTDFPSVHICANESNVFILHSSTSEIKVWNHDEKLIRTFSLDSPSHAPLQNILDVDCDNQWIYILDRGINSIVIYSTDGTYQNILPNLSDILVSPSSFDLHQDLLYIADNANIYASTKKGSIVSRYSLPQYEKNAIITNVSFSSQLHCVVNQSRIYRWNASAAKWDSPLSSFGQENGNFLSIQWFSENGNILVYDSFLRSFSMFHSNKETWNKIESFSLHDRSDFYLMNQAIFAASAESGSYKVFHIKPDEDNQYTLSTKEVQFEEATTTSIAHQYLYLWSNSGFPISGTIKASHPGIRVVPSSFKSHQTSFRVEIDPSQFENPYDVSEFIEIQTSNLSVQKIPVEGHFQNSKPNIVVSPVYDASVDSSKQRLRFHIQKTKDFIDTIQIKFLPSVGKEILQPQTTEEEITEDLYEIISIPLDILPNAEPGIYPVVMQIISNKYRLMKQFTFNIRYHKTLGSISKTQIGELFTAPWCMVCPSAERSIDELLEIYSTKELNFVNYFLDCVNVTELCTSQGDEKKHQYGVSGTPTMVFNGTVKEVGGVKSETATLTYRYLPILQGLEHIPSQFSLTGWALSNPTATENNSSNKEIELYTRIQKADHECNWKDLVLVQIVVENNVVKTKKAKNEDGEIVDVEIIYNHVFRHYIETSKEIDEDSPRYSPFWDSSTRIQVPDYVDINQCYMLFYLQNKETNEILQSRTVLIGESPDNTNSIAPRLHLQQKQLYEHEGPVEYSFVIQNPNPYPVEYGIQVKALNCTMSKDFHVSSNISSDNTITLLPFQYYPVVLEGEMIACNQDATLEISILNATTSVEIPILPSKKPGWFQRIYPKEAETIASGQPWFAIQTIPGTKLLKKNKDTPIAITNQGILLFKPDIEVGANHFQYTLLFPDQSAQDIEYSYFQVVEMEFRLNSDVIQIDRTEKELKHLLFLHNNRTMIGLMDFAETIRCYVEYNAASKAVTFRLNENSISMFMNSSEAYVGEEKYILDAPPQITIRGSFIPFRFLYENFGFTVLWEASNQTIQLTNQP
jgi:hypothetical protein